MIGVKVTESTNNNTAYKVKQVSLFGLIIYESIYSTTDINIVSQLRPVNKQPKIRGFKNETKNQSKKNK